MGLYRHHNKEAEHSREVNKSEDGSSRRRSAHSGGGEGTGGQDAAREEEVRAEKKSPAPAPRTSDGARGGKVVSPPGLGCGVYMWRCCVIREVEAADSSGAIVVEWDDAGGEVSHASTVRYSAVTVWLQCGYSVVTVR